MPPPAGTTADSRDVTSLLQRMTQGEPGALDDLFPLVYDDLRRVAQGQRRRAASQTLGTTALLHEAYLKFARSGGATPYVDREHFFAIAAKAMRQILLDEAKRRLRKKRGGDAPRTDFDEQRLGSDTEVRQAELMVSLDQALDQLGRLHDRVRQVVEYRFFGGLSEQEIANLLGIDRRTVRRDWAKGRAWLALEFS
ncbi:MAG: ECF-type sigma factor [Thermoanaerobaculia bacterium]|nr:ECF-type sigma factor [Thermoanaerobaculia bacterium]